MAREQLRRNRAKAGFGQAAAHILDVFVYAEDFLYHQHDGKIAAFGRACPVGRDCAGRSPVFHGNLYLTCDEAVGVRSDSLAADRLHCQRETDSQRVDQELAAILRFGLRNETIRIGGGHGVIVAGFKVYIG